MISLRLRFYTARRSTSWYGFHIAGKNLTVEKPENVNTAEWNELKLLEQQVQSLKLNDEEVQA